MFGSTSKRLQGVPFRRQLAVAAAARFPTRHHGRGRGLIAIGMTGASRSVSRRPMHTTSPADARLVQGHISITPGATMQLPPTVPIPVDPGTPSAIRSTRARRGDVSGAPAQGQIPDAGAGAEGVANPSGASSNSSSSGISGGKVLGDKVSATTVSPPPLMGKSPTPVSRKLDSLEHQGQPTRGVDLGSIVALDLFLLRTLGQLSFEAGSGGPTYASLDELIRQSRERSGKVLDLDLQYESTPAIERRVSTTVSSAGALAESAVGGRRQERQERPDESESTAQTQSGIVTVAHVMGGKQPRVSVCSGFAIGNSETIVTCAHTLESISRNLDPSAPSVSLVLTSSGHVFPVLSLLSSLPASDLVLLSIPSTALRNPSYRLPPKPTDSFPRLRSLPVSPYPATVGTRIASLEYSSPLMGEGKRQVFGWKHGLVVEYRDSMGRTAETGTYDELSFLRFSSLPNPGSSGGPIVDIETGAVVGVVRGSTKAYGDREERGWGTPAEKVFEWFKLPGFKSKKDTRTVAATEGESRIQEGKKLSK
ncbi:BZ3500_MvSof-1268-A1-R1_Chr1-1g01214 [Microbotryum saponariae]|uniref:BZ3500_MvSof-1268-A1-R1_Chr1-1g01214 protein n=1 Tax=Microbotryum saponariae TaxID=289078 RepID=A0A2X0K9T1_9BASI|nr:BZ3500_MvSof-1268-A1-R1_Chr1-1g01214 [Microbotryum saponariae]SCZ93690.1 BZ3501_MvSof-1269-A2-R1_Chr1-1g00810 [Microbotryum saponariae]